MMNETHKTELQEAVLNVLNPTTPGVKPPSQNELARKMDVSPATIIAIKTGDWTKLSEKMLRHCRSYFRLDDWGIRNTKNFRYMQELCQDAMLNRRCLAVAGYTGAGKTTALEHFAAKNAGAYYVLAKPYHKPRSFMQAIQRAMGITDGYSTAEIIAMITYKMLSTDDCLLIIDDAGKLNSDCMRLIQCIYDDTERKAGIVIAGTEYLKKYIDAQAKANVRGFRELKRRIAYWQPLYPVNRKEVATICKDYGIDDSRAVDYIYKHSGNYKVLSDMILDSVKVANKYNEKVSRDILVDLRLGDHAYVAQS